MKVLYNTIKNFHNNSKEKKIKYSHIISELILNWN